MYVFMYLLPVLRLHVREDAARQAVPLDHLHAAHVHVCVRAVDWGKKGG